MTLRQGLTDLISTLPARSAGSLTEQVIEPAFSVNTIMPFNYVWPDVFSDEDIAPSPIGLVTAPGAMGKSAAARAAAATLNAPLIDLAKVPIGSHSLTGLLTKVLGWSQTPDFVNALRDGTAAIVLDSLDEAQLAAGQAHFTAFLQNVAELVGGGEGKSQVLLFGRRDTMETATLVFADLGMEVAQHSVAPLRYSQSCDLIDLVLDEIVVSDDRENRPGSQPFTKRYTTHRTHVVPFGQYRDATLFDMGKALGAEASDVESIWDEVGDFLGYPPVLLVFARHLIVDNPSALNAADHSHGTGATRGGLLLEVTEEIMARETAKVRSQMVPALGLADTDPKADLLYTRDEQVLRLTGFLLGQPLKVPLPGSLSPQEATIYQEQIDSFVPDHPFLRGQEIENVVFGDYLRAYSEVATGLGVQELPPASTSASVGPFFAHFLHVMAPRAVSEAGGSELPPNLAVIEEKLVDPVVKSFAAGSTMSTSWVYSDPGESVASFYVSENSESEGESRVLSQLDFIVINTSGLLELVSPVSRGLIITKEAVSISSNTEELILGPDLVILVGELFLSGKRLTAISSAESSNSPRGGVLIAIRGGGSLNHDHDLRISAHPPEVLEIASNGQLWHQWHPYKTSYSPENGSRVSAELSWQVTFGLRRLLMVFHSSAADDPSLYWERLERFAVGSNPVFAATLAALLELEVIAREGTLYRLRLSRLGEYGVNWAALVGSEFASTLEALHDDVLKTAALSPLLTADEGEGE